MSKLQNCLLFLFSAFCLNMEQLQKITGWLNKNQKYYKKAHSQLTQGLHATAPSFHDGRQTPSWILSKCK